MSGDLPACPFENAVGHFLNCTIAPYFGVAQTNDVSEGYAILLSAVYGIIAILIGQWLARRRDLAIQRYNSSDKFLSHNNEDMLQTLRDIGIATVDKRKLSTKDAVFIDNFQEIQALLNRFELLSVNIRRGTVSERFIIDMEGGLILKVFNSMSLYVAEVRVMQDSKTIYGNYHALVKRIVLGRSLVLSVLEFFAGKPLYPLSNALFALHYSCRVWGAGVHPNALLSDYADLKETFAKVTGKLRVTVLFLCGFYGLVSLGAPAGV